MIVNNEYLADAIIIFSILGFASFIAFIFSIIDDKVKAHRIKKISDSKMHISLQEFIAYIFTRLICQNKYRVSIREINYLIKDINDELLSDTMIDTELYHENLNIDFDTKFIIDYSHQYIELRADYVKNNSTEKIISDLNKTYCNYIPKNILEIFNENICLIAFIDQSLNDREER
jgi:hypothetical protein